MQDLLGHWDEVKRRILGVEKVLFLSDYDGTLAPIAEKPEMAVLPDRVRRVLARMVANPRYDVTIVSGRSLGEVEGLVRVAGAYYIANNGLEMKGPELEYQYPGIESYREVIKEIDEELRERLSGIEGIILKNRGPTLGLLYRSVSAKHLPTIRAAIKAIVRRHGGLMIGRGKKMVELRPKVPWDKSKACLWLHQRLGGKHLPIYLGDDPADEPVFDVFKEGLTILVSRTKKRSKAKYYIKSVSQVHRFLSLLADLDQVGQYGSIG